MAARHPRVGLGRWFVGLALASSVALPSSRGVAAPAALWSEAAALEGQGHESADPEASWLRYLEAAATFEVVAHTPPGRSDAYWRSARLFWLVGEERELGEKSDRIAYFERSEALAAQGLELDPDCAECMLWKFIATGRLATTRGIWTAMRQVPEMADLLERGIELEPAHRDDEDNSTLGNLHYSSAIFYRVLPDWLIAKLLLGVRGDKERALSHSREAVALHPSRLDYQIEVGTQLMCLGSSRGDETLLAEGYATLRRAVTREANTRDDHREIIAAQIMIEKPARACGYAGDTWIEIDRHQARQHEVSAAP